MTDKEKIEILKKEIERLKKYEEFVKRSPAMMGMFVKTDGK